MNENINLVEILKDCPVGTELYSSIFGYCELDEVILIDVSYPIIIKKNNNNNNNNKQRFTSKGKYIYDEGECTLFPSKENRDWSTFKAPKKEYNFKPFDKVLVRTTESRAWLADFYSHLNEYHQHVTVGGVWECCIPYEGNQELVGTSNPE